MNSILKWLIARPVLAIVGALVALWLLFNYSVVGDMYLLGKYLVLLGVGIYSYPIIEKLIGKTAKGNMKVFITLMIVFGLIYLLRQTFFLAVLILIVGYFVKGD